MSLVALLCTAASATSVKFYEGDLIAARKKANEEGKLFFVDFHAKWCMPCKWMDQTTFSDPEVGRLMNNEFVSVKVDIDDLVGFDLSQKYDVQVLPTILIFNEEGQMIERIEETLTPSKMITILNRHVTTESEPLPVTQSLNRSPRRPSTPTRAASSTTPQRGYYRLQMGSYTQYEAASTKVVALQEQFLEPITVVNEVQNGQVVFKIMMGQFSSESEADSFKQILYNDFGLQASVQ